MSAKGRGFNRANTCALALLTLAFVVGEISRYMVVSLSKEMARDIGFGDKGCYPHAAPSSETTRHPTRYGATAVNSGNQTHHQTYSQEFCQQFTSNSS